ncbi:MAG: sigma-70 family RNA polymerase sigma factor [Verrucomicrobiota bacterium]
MAAYRNGEVEALGKLIEHYRRPLFGFILKMTEGRGDAEEVFQEVWFRAIRRLDSYKDKSFLSWLFRIAHNLVIDMARKRKPDFSLNESHEDAQPMEEKLPSGKLGPDAEVGGFDIGQRIARAVDKLPPEQKEVFVLRTEAELPFKEIAKIQDSSINTALARMQYALAKLKEELAEDYKALGK